MESVCDSGWSAFGGHCYRFYTASKSYEKASERCLFNDATLVSVHDQDTNFFLTQLARSTDGSSRFWLGMRISMDGAGAWEDGATVVYTNWAANEPQDFYKYSNLKCTQSMNGEWSAYKCSYDRPYMCRKLTAEESTRAKKCPSGWKWYEHSCYKKSTQTTNFAQARSSCQADGADLAVVNNLGIQLIINGLLGSSGTSWIGITQLTSAYRFTWVDGSTGGSFFVNWKLNEPNQFSRMSVGVRVRQGRWQDYAATRKQSSICSYLIPDDVVFEPIGTCTEDTQPIGLDVCRDVYSSDGLSMLQQCRSALDEDQLMALKVQCVSTYCEAFGEDASSITEPSSAQIRCDALQYLVLECGLDISWISATNCEDYISQFPAPCTEATGPPAKEACSAIDQGVEGLSSCRETLGNVRVYQLKENCMTRVCAEQDTASDVIKCEDVENMVQECQRVVPALVVWHEDAQCVCSINEGFNGASGVASCEKTCEQEIAASSNDLSCQVNSIKECLCLDGHFREDGVCVAKDQCGCVRDGEYKQAGDFWMLTDCSSMIKCMGNGLTDNVDITKHSPEAECRDGDRGRNWYCRDGFVGDGIYCWDPKLYTCSCSVSGIGHYHTFDDNWVTFNGDCTYTLASSTTGAPSPKFTVNVDMRKDSDMSSVHPHGVIVQVYGYTFALYPDKIHVQKDLDEEWLEITTDVTWKVSRDIEGLVYVYSSPVMVLRTDFGLEVRYTTKPDGNNAVSLNVPTTYQTYMQGICGACNGDRDDDLPAEAGSDEEKYVTLGNGQWVPNPLEVGCSAVASFSVRSAATAGCDAQEVASRLTHCLPLKDSAVFATCLGVLGQNTADAFMMNCALDICVSGSVEDALCSQAAAMVEHCVNKLGNQVNLDLGWREVLKCPLSCGADGTYKEWDNCAEDVSTTNSFKPVESCTCLPNLFSIAEKCVQNYDGVEMYHMRESSWQLPACGGSVFKCTADGNVEPLSNGCHDDATCLDGECECKTNYVGDGLDCEAKCSLADIHCDNCTATNACAHCQAYYYMATDGRCNECTEPNCARCNPTGECEDCKVGYDLNLNKHCQGPCKVKECVECMLDDTETCSVCENPDSRSDDGKRCTEEEEVCNVNNCFECHTPAMCKTCKQGHYRDMFGQCPEKCTSRDALCKTCDFFDMYTCVGCYANGETEIPRYISSIDGRCHDCVVHNCTGCNTEGRCVTCSVKYYVTDVGECALRCTHRDDNCVDCVPDNPGLCVKCEPGFTITDGGEGMCTECGEHCESCTEAGCQRCKAGYFINPKNQCSAYCQTQDVHCDTCVVIDQSQCAKCDPNYYLDDDTKICKECVINHCKTCGGDGSCAVCKDGFLTFDDGGSCEAMCNTTDPNCVCEEGRETVCEGCVSNRYYISQDKRCMECQFENCLECDTDGSCKTCKDGFAINSCGLCQGACEVQFCDQCDCLLSTMCTLDGCQENYQYQLGSCVQHCTETGNLPNCAACMEDDISQCKTCKTGFHLTQEGQCEACGVEWCMRCPGGTCDRCSEEYFVRDGQCEPLCDRLNSLCEHCADDDPSMCATCRDPRAVVTSNRTCAMCDQAHCAQCSPDLRCRWCEENYKVDEDGRCEETCKVTDPNCLACIQSNLQTCAVCKNPGKFFVSGDGKCYSCEVLHCSECDKTNPSGTVCETCKDGYFVNQEGNCEADCHAGDPNCYSCDPKAQRRCGQCHDDVDYYVHSMTGKCSECARKFCKGCDGWGNCAVCDDEFVVTDSGDCEPRTTTPPPPPPPPPEPEGTESPAKAIVPDVQPPHPRPPAACTLEGCRECDWNFGGCKHCEEGWELHLSQCRQTRHPCLTDHCDLCNDDGDCVSCAANWVLSNGRCIGEWLAL